MQDFAAHNGVIEQEKLCRRKCIHLVYVGVCAHLFSWHVGLGLKSCFNAVSPLIRCHLLARCIKLVLRNSLRERDIQH